MAKPYDPSAAEAKWQKKWADDQLYQTDLSNADEKYFSMVMFPYPSGDKLHVGHWYNYAPADSFARYMRMQGKNVFSPMGFDAFGLPAENYAIKTGIHPRESIAENTATMTEQLKRIGMMYDWDKTVNTSQPEYYRWTQWLFLQMHRQNLAYRKEANVNWCPSCQTVLANEQAQDGTCERCGTEVEKKPMTQWYWKTTDYAQRLLDGLENLDWPEKTKAMQRNWIGRSEGAHVTFEVDGHDDLIKVFTTRPDTLFGATYIVLAPEHPLVKVLTTDDQSQKINSYIVNASKRSEIERTSEDRVKTGEFTGSYAINPVNNEKMPIWIADYVLYNYGTGSIMAVPGHDDRDLDFAEPHGIEVKNVINPDKKTPNFSSYVHRSFAATTFKSGDLEAALKQRDEEDYNLVLQGKKAWLGGGTMRNSGFLDGMKVEDAKMKMIEWLEKEGKGKGVVNYKLRDWSISRQRYWGAPIPIVYDPEGNPHPIPEEHLPWTLPEDVEFKPTGTSPLAQSQELIERTEKLFGKGWTPEVDTMDTFVCSSFYYLRYLAEGNEETVVPKDVEKDWMPVDMYIGGPEHACMHLIYARFVMMALHDAGVVSHEEPFQRLVHQGLITNQGAKMSKSKGNVVSPDEFVSQYGSDVFRMYLMFMGPFVDGGDWSDTGIKGIDRFVQKIWKVLVTATEKKLTTDSPEITAKLHATIRKVTEDIEKLQFNTAISALMELLNDLDKQDDISADLAADFARLLSPLAPHLAEEIWEQLDGYGSIVDQPWPTYNESLIKSDTMTIAVQVNGKVRADFEASSDITEAEAIALAKDMENVRRHIEEKDVVKEIYVPGKLVNIVVKG